MKRNALLLALGILAGCGPEPSPSVDFAAAQSIAANHGPAAMVACMSNALRCLPNRGQFETNFAKQADAIAVDYLTSLSPGELARRLDTITRGTTRSPYTAEQIHRARKAKGLE